MRNYKVCAAAASASIMLIAASAKAQQTYLDYGFESNIATGDATNPSGPNGFYVNAGSETSVGQSTTGATQGAVAGMFVAPATGYNIGGFETNVVPTQLTTAASFNYDLTTNAYVNYAYIFPEFFGTNGLQLVPANYDGGVYPNLGGATLSDQTETANLVVFADPNAAANGNNTLYDAADWVANFAPSDTITGFQLSVENGGAYQGPNTLTLYIDNITTPVTGPVVSAWSVDKMGNYNNASNWGGTVPNAIGAEADLFGSITTSRSVNTDTAITLGTLNFNNANTYVLGGAGSLTMQTSSGAASVIVQAGTQKINLPLTIASSTNLNVSSGATLLISDPVTIDAGKTLAAIGSGTVTYQSTITVGTGATFAVSSSTSANALTLLAGADATISNSSSGKALVQLGSLSLGSASVIDLKSNDLVVHIGDLSAITAAVKSGFAGGAWNGSGATSSTAAANTSHLTTLGVAAFGSGTAISSIDGATLAAGDVVVKYTYYGDADLNGKVDASDYSRIDSGYLTKATGWANGDFNYDGVINGSDYTLIDNAFNTQGSAISSAVAAPLAELTAEIAGSPVTAAVPEPTTLALLALGGIGLLGRRRTQ